MQQRLYCGTGERKSTSEEVVGCGDCYWTIRLENGEGIGAVRGRNRGANRLEDLVVGRGMTYASALACAPLRRCLFTNRECPPDGFGMLWTESINQTAETRKICSSARCWHVFERVLCWSGVGLGCHHQRLTASLSRVYTIVRPGVWADQGDWELMRDDSISRRTCLISIKENMFCG